MTDKPLILVLGDQLSPELSSLAAAPNAPVLMAELSDEASYVRHHQQKIALIFSAMRHFAETLKNDGRTVIYLDYGSADGVSSFADAVAHLLAREKYTRLIVTASGEWRLMQEMKSWSEKLGIEVDILPDSRFLATHAEFEHWAEGKKQLRMEFFYREMRRKTGLLMEGNEPIGGQWNYDAENRKKLPKGHMPPPRLEFAPDGITENVLDVVKTHFGNHVGTLDKFAWPVTAAQAQEQFAHWLDFCLPQFGDYQDAMKTGEAFLYHGLIGAALNIGLLDPLAVCRAVEARYHSGQAPLNAVEGFIRQILGWREFIRGLYWLKMPDYAASNYFDHHRKLPDFYYSGETDMACMREAIGATREHAYAHHIQRLMVTGNFALLAGIEPSAVNQWYLEVYADAFEWVQLPNTHGMALFADGGVVGSKPYSASGAYINRMSDHCGTCAYKVKEPHGETACPFNYLYWDFMIRHRDKLGGNPRMGMVYRNLDKMPEEKRLGVEASAKKFLEQLT
jgi:deoxyribodipyrimidine photolyase-related protein